MVSAVGAWSAAGHVVGAWFLGPERRSVRGVRPARSVGAWFLPCPARRCVVFALPGPSVRGVWARNGCRCAKFHAPTAFFAVRIAHRRVSVARNHAPTRIRRGRLLTKKCVRHQLADGMSAHPCVYFFLVNSSSQRQNPANHCADLLRIAAVWGPLAENRRSVGGRASRRGIPATPTLTAPKASNDLLGMLAVRTRVPHGEGFQQPRPARRPIPATPTRTAPKASNDLLGMLAVRTRVPHSEGFQQRLAGNRRCVGPAC